MWENVEKLYKKLIQLLTLLLPPTLYTIFRLAVIPNLPSAVIPNIPSAIIHNLASAV
jgi:hypothetical protein